MSGMFQGATIFNQNLENWNTSSLTNLNGVFYNAISFNSNLSNWDTSKVTIIDNLFRNASAFNGNVSNWNLSKLSSTSESVFSGATAFNQPIGNWDVSRMISFNSWFANAASFNQDLSNWNTSSATNTGGMFNNATSFNGNISNWDIGKVTSMSGMFSGASSFNQNIGGWNVSKVSVMTNMFLGVALSSSNYDALLIGWASLSPNLKNNTILNAGGSIYTNASLYARNILINSHNWTIIDGGLFVDSIPPIFITIPADVSLFYGNESLLVQFIGTDETAFDSYSVNDTTNFIINPSGFLSNNTALPVGYYQVNITINDTSNNINWVIYNIVIKSQDTIPPVITIISPQSTVNSQTVNLTITTNELAYCIYNLDNTGNISFGNNITYFTMLQTLSYNNHNIIYYCHDSSNNNNSISQTFNVHQVSNGNIITGSSIPIAERFNSLVISSSTFNFDTSSPLFVQALNPNGNAILIDNISIELLNNISYTKSLITVDTNNTYKRNFNVANNENVTRLNFRVIATKGDKTISQDYSVNIIQGSFINRVKIDMINFFTDYILYIGIFFLFLILLLIIAQASRNRKKRSNRY